jgi:7-carboxy-7-deazaguanine synthase
VKLFAIAEISYSIEGEGVQAGVPAVFIRFADRSREVPVRDRLTANDVAKLARICSFRCRWAVLTGAEPALQLDSDLVDALHEVDFKVAIETSRTAALDAFPLDWITVVSPICGAELRVSHVDEIRYTIRDGDPVPVPPVRARNYVLLPAVDGDQIDPNDLEWCIRLAKSHPQWRLSIPQRKISGRPQSRHLAGKRHRGALGALV